MVMWRVIAYDIDAVDGFADDDDVAAGHRYSRRWVTSPGSFS